MQPEVVQSTDFLQPFSASSVLILGEKDGWLDLDNRTKFNFWLAEIRKIIGQGFTMRVDNCTRLIAGCQVKNKGKGKNPNWATKEFRVSGALDENGPWQTLVEDQLVDTRAKPASLLNFTFEEPVKVQFLKFDLISYWGPKGGGLQYFAAIPATMPIVEVTSKYILHPCVRL